MPGVLGMTLTGHSESFIFHNYYVGNSKGLEGLVDGSWNQFCMATPLLREA